MTGYHVTTPRKVERYIASGCILPPVRFWLYEGSATAWAARVKRSVLLRIEVGVAYPLPDHKPNGHAWWTPEHVREWNEVTR